jgi:hypothetical protein
MKAVSAILTHWHIPPALLPLFLDRADGLAALALLCNAGAKDWPNRPGDPQLYALKADVVQYACHAAGRERSWVTAHIYARRARWSWLTRLNIWWHEHIGFYLFGAETMLIYFLETGLSLEGEPLQLSFHFRPGDMLPRLPVDWPTANDRRWRGQAVQAQAFEIALTYLRSRGITI